MRIRIVSQKSEIPDLNPDERILHLTFRPSNIDVLRLLDTCPKLEAIQVPKSFKRTISKSIKAYLSIKHIRLMEGDVWGHRKDIAEYYEIPGYVTDGVCNLKKEKLPRNDIKEHISKKYKINRDLVGYMIDRGEI
jgi:hypothetical protein